MRQVTTEEWENRYITGEIKQFDQRYTMFGRYNWDSSVKGRLEDWSVSGAASDRAGLTRKDMALREATDHLNQMFRLWNASKPRVSDLTRNIMSLLGQPASHPRASEGLSGQPPAEGGNPLPMTEVIKKITAFFGADRIGICRLDRRWIYSHTYLRRMPGQKGESLSGPLEQEIPEEFQSVIVMVFEMDYDLYRYSTCAIAGGATGMGYSRMAFTSALVAGYIRSLGYRAIDCAINDVGLSVPMAMQAGLGELGRHGLLITPDFGPRVRLEKVITDLPLEPDAPVDFGVTRFCTLCKKCARLCPSRSIRKGERTDQPLNPSNAPGVNKWPVNAETCRIYWAQAKRGGGCNICISCCPYNKPSTPFHRAVRWMTDHAGWADSLYIAMDDLCGYGKPRPADRFWEEWQPKRYGRS